MFRKKPKIEFWATVPGIEKTSPIRPAKEVLPRWWKDISLKENTNLDEKNLFIKFFGENRTVKKCPAIKNYLTYGWVLTMWCDLVVKVVGDNITYQYSLPGWEGMGSRHPNWQMINFLPDTVKKKYLCVFKPGCPWLVKTSPGYSTLHLDPFYFFNPNFDAATGIQESDIYHDLSPQLLLKKEECFIPKGTPLQIIIPIKREKIEGCVIPHNNKTSELQSFSNLVSFSKFSSAASYNEHIKNNGICPFS